MLPVVGYLNFDVFSGVFLCAAGWLVLLIPCLRCLLPVWNLGGFWFPVGYGFELSFAFSDHIY